MKYPKGCTVLVPWLDHENKQQMSRLRFTEDNVDRRKVRKYVAKWMKKFLGVNPTNQQLDNIFSFYCLATEDVPVPTDAEHQELLDRMAVAFNDDADDAVSEELEQERMYRSLMPDVPEDVTIH